MTRLRARNHGAFSLIEVVCVVAVAAILLGAIFGVATTTISAIRGTRESMRRTRVAAGVARLLRRDFEYAFRVRGKDVVTLKGGPTATDQSEDFLEFFTTNSLARRGRLPETGLSRVTYSFRASARSADRFQLVRTEQPYDAVKGLSGTAVGEALTDGLTRCRVMFHNGSEWRDNWKMQALPPGMRIQLAFDVDDAAETHTDASFFAPLVDPRADPWPVK